MSEDYKRDEGIETETETETEITPHVAVTGDVETVFDAWRESTGKTRAVLDPKRRKRIQNALRTFPADDLIDAVRGWKHSPHHAGENERATVYNELELILRDAAHVEQFRDLERGEHGTAKPGAGSDIPEDWS